MRIFLDASDMCETEEETLRAQLSAAQAEIAELKSLLAECRLVALTEALAIARNHAAQPECPERASYICDDIRDLIEAEGRMRNETQLLRYLPRDVEKDAPASQEVQADTKENEK